MGTVEPPSSYWNGIGSGGGEDESEENLFSLLDITMESLEEMGDLEGDGLIGSWDDSNSQCLGPIPADMLMDSTLMSNSKFAPPAPSEHAPISETPQHKLFPSHDKEPSRSVITWQNKFSHAHEFGVFQMQSPVSVLESSGFCSAGKSSSLAIKSEIAIPVKTRSRRVRSSTTNPWVLASHILSPAATNKSSNVENTKEKKRKRLSRLSISTGCNINSSCKEKASLDAIEQPNTSSQKAAATKKCAHCEVTKTPQWREGPSGPKTLCNACGVRYRSGRLFPEYRPAASPTFVPSLHSNSHRKVIQMRNNAKHHAPNVEEAQLLVTMSSKAKPPIEIINKVKQVEPKVEETPPPEILSMSSNVFDFMY